MSAPMIEVERLRTALREIEQATEGIPEQNCMLANRIARLALRDTAPARHYKLLPEEAAKCRCENCIKDYPDLAFHCLCPAGLHMPACACACHAEEKP